MSQNIKKFIAHSIFNIISDIAHKKGVQAFVIGGYVRDSLLNRSSKDIDIVILGSGIDFALSLCKELGIEKELTVFRNFGTAMIKWENLEIEFVGARKESYRRNSRKPIVEEGTLIDDQNRRDFSINALAISLQKENFGELSDPFNGLPDLNNKLIRTPLNPDITYSDDPLRMMRAIRFASQLGFEIEKKSLEAISVNKERISIVSMERIADELNKIILSPKPSVGFKLLFETGLLEIIFPQMNQLHGVEVINGKGHKDNFFHTLKVLDNICLKTDNLWLRWASILHDIAKSATKRFDEIQGWTFHGHEDKGAKMVPEIFARFKLPLNEKMKYVQKLVFLHLRPIALSKETITDSAIRRLLFEAGEDIDDLLILCEADITSKNPIKVKKFLENFKIVRQKLAEVEEKDKIRNWQPPISGGEIMKTFNIKEGKEVGIIKNNIKEAILEGLIHNNYNEAFDFMILEGKKMGLFPNDGKIKNL
jgi:putative nucleotidyltransferase with HDIG domain